MIIYKYSLNKEGATKIQAPVEAQVLTAQLQGDEIVLWLLVNPNRAFTTYVYEVVFTGEPLPPLAYYWKYINTVQLDGLVYHIFKK